jgi:hypothetical protein
MRGIITTLVLVVLVLSSAGCGDADSADSDAIHGTWVTELEGKYQTFNEDGSWTAKSNPDISTPTDKGTYTYDGETLTVISDPGYGCDLETARQGSYEVEVVDEDTLALTLIDDECGPRSADMASGMTRYAP